MKHTVFHAPADWRPHDLVRAMFAKKCKKIGDGAYAVAYWSPKLNRVIKIGDLSDPYLDYLRAIKRSRTPSKYFPKIHEIIECHEAGADWEDQEGAYAVVMERLQDTHKQKFEVVRAMVCNHFDDWGDYDYDRDDVAKHKAARLVKEALKAAKRVARLANSVGADLDMHDGNILFRKNGQLVITDPFC